MKKLISVLIVLLTIVGVNAQSIKGFKMGHNYSTPQLSSNSSAISYVQFSKSINGPFVSPDTLLAKDSLFIFVLLRVTIFIISEDFFKFPNPILREFIPSDTLFKLIGDAIAILRYYIIINL